MSIVEYKPTGEVEFFTLRAYSLEERLFYNRNIPAR